MNTNDRDLEDFLRRYVPPEPATPHDIAMGIVRACMRRPRHGHRKATVINLAPRPAAPAPPQTKRRKSK